MRFIHSKKYIKKRKRRLFIICVLLFVLLSAVCISGFFIISPDTVTTVLLDGKEIGIIDDSEITALTDSINEIYSSLNKNFSENLIIPFDFEFSEKTVIGNDKKRLEKITAEDSENLVVEYDDRIDFSYSVTLNGEVVADVGDVSSAESALFKAENELKEIISEAGSEIADIRSANEIGFTRRIAPCEKIIDGDLFYNLLCGETGINHTHPAASQIAETQSAARTYKEEANIYYTEVLEAVEDTSENEEIQIIPYEAAECLAAEEEAEVESTDENGEEASGDGSDDAALDYSISDECIRKRHL